MVILFQKIAEMCIFMATGLVLRGIKGADEGNGGICNLCGTGAVCQAIWRKR